MAGRPPAPPFDRRTAVVKVPLIEEPGGSKRWLDPRDQTGRSDHWWVGRRGAPDHLAALGRAHRDSRGSL